MKSQHPLFGFCLALVATIAWGTVPIATQQVLTVVNAQTLVWARFVVAGLGLLCLLGLRKKLPRQTQFDYKMIGLMVLGVLGLSANFFLFSYALNFISPTTSQVLWQLAPFTMMLCGIVIFKEPFGLHQKIGLGLLIVGLLAFFNHRFAEILQWDSYAFGIAVGASSALVWVAYGIAQKLMLAKLDSQQILLIIYLGCSLTLLPFANVAQLPNLSGFGLVCFIYCCLNTLIGYGAYAEALNRWEASKVSVVTTLVPIFTMIFSALGNAFAPELFARTEMNTLSYIGALVVVLGTIISATGHKLWKK